jgi:hypothetical protein
MWLFMTAVFWQVKFALHGLEQTMAWDEAMYGRHYGLVRLASKSLVNSSSSSSSSSSSGGWQQPPIVVITTSRMRDNSGEGGCLGQQLPVVLTARAVWPHANAAMHHCTPM